MALKLLGTATSGSLDAATKSYVDTRGTLATCRAATNTEVLTIVSGSVTQIAGLTVDDVTVAAGDRILIPNAPAATGAAGTTTLSSQPANGIYVAGTPSTNIPVTRVPEMSAPYNPAGREVSVTDGTVWCQQQFMVVFPENPAAAMVYGTTNIQWISNLGAVSWAARTTGGHAVPAARTYWANKVNTSTMPTTEDTGQPIVITSGVSSTAAINSGRLISVGGSGASDIYYQFDPSSAVTRVGARFVLGHTVGTTTGGVVALLMANGIINAGTLPTVTISPHLTVSAQSWQLGTFSSGTNNVRKSGNFATQLKIDTTIYEVEMWIVGNTVTVALPDGSMITDTNAAYVAGVVGGVEPFSNVAATDNFPGIVEHWWDCGPQQPPTGQYVLQDQVQQVAASRLARPGSNMVYSPNFETAAAWAGLNLAGLGVVSAEQAYTGANSWKFTSNGTVQRIDLLCDTYGVAVYAESQPGRTYRFECQLRAKSTNVGTGSLYLVLDALTNAGHISFPLQTTISPPSTALSTSAWTKFVGYGTMPATTCYMSAALMSNTTPSGDVFYIDGVVVEDVTNLPSMMSLSADYTLSNVATAQKAFATTNGAITLPANSSYLLEAEYMITNTGATSHTWAVLFGGTATLTALDYTARGRSGATSQLTLAADSSASQSTGAGALPTTALVMTAASTSTTENVLLSIRGTLRVNAAGTFIPQVKLSAATGTAAKMLRGSFIRLTPLGPGNATSIGDWS